MAAIELCQLIEDNAYNECWDLAQTQTAEPREGELSHINRMYLFHEYEIKKILSRYSYAEAKEIMDKYQLSYTE